MVSVGLKITKRFILSVFLIIYIGFFLHTSCVSTSLNQKAKEQNKQSSKFMPYTQPYYNQAFFNQQYPYSTSDNYPNLNFKNLTIEVLPNDDEDEDDGYLKFGLLRDAYGYGDSIQSLKMVLNSTMYNCNYTTNIYTKSKKWNTGLLKARSNHGSVTLTLYELDEKSNSCGKLIDKFDIFNSKTNTLSGKEFITGRNLIDVQDIFGQKYNKPTEETYAPKPTIRTGLQRFSKPRLDPYKRPEKSSNRTSRSSTLPSFTPNFNTKPSFLFKSDHNLPTSNVNVNDIIKNIELMLDDD